MPEVLMLAKDDWANTGWRFFKCIQSLGIDILALKSHYHRMAYPEQIPIHPVMAVAGAKQKNAAWINIPELIVYANKAKVIHYIGSCVIFCGVELNDKKVVMQHGGTAYRNHYKDMNEAYEDFVDVSIIQCPDLLGLGAKNEQWIYYPVDTDYIKPDFTTKDKLVIGHFPSNPDVKGSNAITKVIRKLESDPEYKNRFEYIGIRSDKKHTWSKEFIKDCLVYWVDNLQRLKKCDIIIETMALSLQGETYGEWGNTAIESAALGNIVVTNSLTSEQYKKEYGDCALNIANNEIELESTLKRLLSYSNKEISVLKQRTRQWVEDNHSMPVTAQRIWNKVYKHLI